MRGLQWQGRMSCANREICLWKLGTGTELDDELGFSLRSSLGAENCTYWNIPYRVQAP